LDKDFFKPWIEKGNSLLRSIHYPPVDGNTNPHRARAHTDINLITLLIGAEEGGLEVLNKDGSWIKVEPSSNAIVCNIGDMMQLVTDKSLVSTTHRVIQDIKTKSKPRYSIPFFLHPAPSVLLKSVFNENDKGVLADDFLDERLKAIKLY
jgi:isopenicillin N synthase-like dioxygenase